MKHYTLVAKQGRGFKKFTTKAKNGTEAKAKVATETGKDASLFSVLQWQEKGRGGKVLRERNYTVA